jgi:dimethylargininase
VVFVPAGFPLTHTLLRDAGFALEILDMSEFEKMDGALTCLSVRI